MADTWHGHLCQLPIQKLIQHEVFSHKIKLPKIEH